MIDAIIDIIRPKGLCHDATAPDEASATESFSELAEAVGTVRLFDFYLINNRDGSQASKGLYHDATAPDEAKRILLRKKRKKKGNLGIKHKR